MTRTRRTADTHTLTIDIPRAWWLTANMRPHWAAKANRTRSIRQRTFAAARILPHIDRCNITAAICYPSSVRADPANASPVVKAAIDGIVDAGVLDDDDHKHVPIVAYTRGPNTGQKGLHRLILTLEPLS